MTDNHLTEKQDWIEQLVVCEITFQGFWKTKITLGSMPPDPPRRKRLGCFVFYDQCVGDGRSRWQMKFLHIVIICLQRRYMRTRLKIFVQCNVKSMQKLQNKIGTHDENNSSFISGNWSLVRHFLTMTREIYNQLKP